MDKHEQLRLFLIGHFMKPAESLRSLHFHVEVWQEHQGLEPICEGDVLSAFRSLVAAGLLNVWEATSDGLVGVDYGRSDDESFRRYWFDPRVTGNELHDWFVRHESSRVERLLEGGELVMRDWQTGGVLWRGGLDGQRVRRHVSLPDSDDCVALPEGGAFVARVSPLGDIRWRARFTDYWVDVGWRDDDGLVAWTASGDYVVLDPASGRVVRSEFVK